MEQQYEIIKAMAYGQSNEEIAAAERMAVEEVAAIRANQEGEIEAAKADLRKAGYTE